MFIRVFLSCNILKKETQNEYLLSEIFFDLPNLFILQNSGTKYLSTFVIFFLYKYLFEIDSVDLSFREEALKSIAKRAIARKTGARGLRSILEDILMDVMFELPNEDLEKVIIDENSADNGSEPIKVFKTPKKKSSAS